MAKLTGFDPNSDEGQALIEILKISEIYGGYQCQIPNAPTSRRKTPALAARSLFVLWESLWDSFTQTRKDGWTTYWGTLPFSPHTGAGGWPGSGYSAFVYVNAPRYRAGLSLILDAFSLGWEVSSMPTPSRSWNDLLYMPSLGKFVGVGTSSAVVHSTDGITWTRHDIAAAGSLTGVATNDSVLVAVRFSQNPAIISSANGTSWTQRVALTLPMNGVIYGGGLFLATATGGGLNYFTSSNGLSWNLLNLTQANGWRSPAYVNGYYIMISGTTGNLFAYSTDGSTWNTATITGATTLAGVAYFGGYYYMGENGFPGGVWRSTDLSTWVFIEITDISTVRYIRVIGSYLFIMNQNSETGPFYSTDGLNFYASYPSEQRNWYGIADNGTRAAVLSQTTSTTTLYLDL